jgi:hypothetical protein
LRRRITPSFATGIAALCIDAPIAVLVSRAEGTDMDTDTTGTDR